MKASISICGFLSICSFLGVAASGQMVGTSLKEDKEEEDMSVRRRTGDQVTVEGAVLVLACETNRKWQLCSWSSPGGQWCHTLGGGEGRRFCEEDERIEFVMEDDHACSVVVHGVRVGDRGVWQCKVKEEVQGEHVAGEEIKVIVATPYKLSIDEHDIVKDSNQTSAEVGCVAEGGGGVELEMEWRVDGKSRGQRLRSEDTVTKLVLELGGVSHGAVLRCLGRQLHPDTGRVLFESSVYSVLGLTQEPVVTEKVSSSTRFAGIAIGGLFCMVLLIAIIFFMVGHRNKCFFSNNKKSAKDVGVDTSAPDGIEVEYGHKEGRANNEYVRLVKVDRQEDICEDCEIELKSKKIEEGSSVLRDAAEQLSQLSNQQSGGNKTNPSEGGEDKAVRTSLYSEGCVSEKKQPIYAQINFDKKNSKKWSKHSDQTATVYAVIKHKADTEGDNNELKHNINIENDNIKYRAGSSALSKTMNETNF